ncbi:hypothetical protein MSI_22600 [Treponema sp. JC4]|uniref:hypothetical protein n=1 Tax=Treponema sp. JC4 TaxID=1124982 RepID=UPI00025B0593|nr:hypothetical protein [Treponema sp. JC4]EID84277.1 hypothetical protein MSI_22600 [Treponema sp. JC4]
MAKRKEIEKNFVESLQQKKMPDGFIRLTDNPVEGLSSEQKVILNRKANTMFNNGNIEDARRIFITTGYSDGLTRVGNHYMDKNQSLKALKAYYLAHNNRETEPIYEQIAKVISKLITD